MISEPRLRTLLAQAAKTAENGKLAAALALYQQIVAEAPDSAEAWLGLARLETNQVEKDKAYQRALALEPDNPLAQVGLADLRKEPVAPELRAAAAALTQKEETETAEEDEEEPETAVAPDPLAEPEHHDHEELSCYRHPNRTTGLRCYTCGKPICMQCAKKTPVGYRCPDCIREAEDAFFNARPVDYLVAPLISLPLSLLAGFLLRQIGGGFFFILLIFFVAGAVGGFIGRLAKTAVGRRRGRYLPHVVSATVIIGGMLAAAPALINLVFGNFGGLFGLIVPGLYTFIASTAAFYQMK